ncbi:putative alcohol dehydrogenase [Escherichia coli]|uniref:Putative alcohol dehydrogenase n=1 Tax=Escherichia coli TaxID=562 RepID=A0A2X3JP35_ECOLX|nr:putative alcohol dehydrogenase [Escherichia coli]
MNAVKLVREQKVTFLLALAAVLYWTAPNLSPQRLNYPENIDPWHILQTGGKEIKSAIPMGCVLTLPATGSESNAGAVISRKTTGDKAGVPFCPCSARYLRTRSGLYLHPAAASGG